LEAAGSDRRPFSFLGGTTGVSPPPNFAFLLSAVLLASCATPPAASRLKPDDATPVVADQTPRSPQNAALAFRATLLFERFCQMMDFAAAGTGAEALRFRRADSTISRGVLRDKPGEVWLYDGYDKYFLILRSAEPRSCELGVHLATVEQIDAPFAAAIQKWRGQGYAISPLQRDAPVGVLYRAVAPDGRQRAFGVVPATDPGSPIRSVLIAVAGP